ncbi:hypothetical protein ACFLSJ_07325 [Verrucomicrobiota bacterium]
MRDNARRAVGAHLNVQWTDTTVPKLSDGVRSKAQGYQELASSIEAVTAGKSPSLLFVISDDMKPKRSRSSKEEPTQQTKDSEAAWVEIFQTEGDYTVYIPGRFFNVVRVDASGVREDDNKYVCSENAPLVLLTRTDGQVETFFEGRAKIKRRNVVNAMCTVLKKDEVVRNMNPFTKLHELMKQLERAELAILKLADNLKELQGKLSKAQARDQQLARKRKKPVEASTSTLQTEKRIVLFKDTKVLPAKTAKFDILNEEYVVLEDVGLPAAKMPPKPVEPKDGELSRSSTYLR